MLIRLQLTIAAVCPIDGVSGSATGPSTVIRIDYAASATAPQRAAAAAALAAFDWSQAAQDAWEIERARTEAKSWVLGDETDARGLKALALLLLDEINIVRQNPTAVLAVRTKQQLLDAWIAKIDVT